MTAETGTDGAAITTGVVGSWQYSSAAKRSGNLGYRFNQSGTTANNYTSGQLASSVASGTTSERWRGYHKISAYPAAGSVGGLYTVKSQNGTIDILRIWINSNGTLGLGDANGTTLYTSIYAVPLNTFFRIEFVVQVGTTGTVGIIGFGAVTGSSTLTTTNSSTQAYYWTTTANTGSNSGHGNTVIGKNDTTNTWTCSSDLDDVSADSAAAAPTWTSNPSTWVGPGVSTSSSVMAAAASGILAVNGAKNDISTSVMVASTALIVLDGVRGQNSVLAAASATSLSVAVQTDRVGILSLAGLGALAISGSDTISSSIALAGLGGLTVGAVREQLFVLVMNAAGSSLAVTPLRTQPATILMSGTSIFVSIPTPGQSDILPLASQGMLSVAGSDLLSFVLPLGAVAALNPTGSKSLGGVLAALGVATLAVGGLGSRTVVLAASGTPAMSIALLVTHSGVWVASGVAGLGLLVRVFPDIHPYDNVLAAVLNGSGLVVPYLNSVRGVVLDGGLRTAPVLIGSGAGQVLSIRALVSVLLATGQATPLDSGRRNGIVQSGTAVAVMLPNGMIAVVQD